MAAKAVAFREANDSKFQDYATQIVKNASAMAEACQKENAKAKQDSRLIKGNVTSRKR